MNQNEWRNVSDIREYDSDMEKKRKDLLYRNDKPVLICYDCHFRWTEKDGWCKQNCTNKNKFQRGG